MVKKRKDTDTNNVKSIFRKSDSGNSLDPSSHNFVYDEVDDFHAERDKDMLTFDGVDNSYSKEQVLSLGRLSSDDEDDYDSDDESEEDIQNIGKVGSDEEDYFLPDDDIVDKNEEVSDDDRAWGSKKSHYFGTDTTDEKIHREAMTRWKKEEQQLMEEEGAKRFQARMADQLKGLTFDDLIPVIEKPNEEEEEVIEDTVKIDVDRLSSKKKIRLLKEESPEFMPLVQDLKDKCEELQTILQPLMDAISQGCIPHSPIVDYLKARYSLCLNYVTVVCSYMMIKSSGTNVASHPVIERLAQYRHLFKELEVCQTLYEPDVLQLLIDLSTGKLKPPKKMTKKKLALLEKAKVMETGNDNDDISKLERALDPEGEDSGDEEMELIGNEGGDVLGKDERRSIGKAILKNKGLMARRNKDKRNPRVHYKNKYKNKVKRRKGQVQNVSKELHRYAGEVTGIKSNVIKSRRLQ